MTLPMTTYEDTVGTRITLIDYSGMANMILNAHPTEVEDMLRHYGDLIYSLGMKHEAPPALIQPLKAVAP